MKFRHDQRVTWRGHRGKVTFARVVYFGDLSVEEYVVEMIGGGQLICSEMDLEAVPAPGAWAFEPGKRVRVKGTQFTGSVESSSVECMGDVFLKDEVVVRQDAIPGVRVGTFTVPSCMLEVIE